MERSVPLWLLLLLLLFGLLFTVAFGWSIKSTLQGNDRSGKFGEAAVWVANFPTSAKKVFRELLGYTSGDYKDVHNRILRHEPIDYSLFDPVRARPGIELPGLLIKGDPSGAEKGWRLLAGVFEINQNIQNAALLISPDLDVIHKWVLDEIPVGDLEPREKHRKLVHGIEIERNGSLIFSFDGGVSLQKIDACGVRQWAIPGKFHHAVTLSEHGQSVWALLDEQKIAEVDAKNGEIIRIITMDEVIAANPMIDILELRRVHSSDLGLNSRNTQGRWMEDPFHFNDVEPLPSTYADRFSAFNPGDLLLSARSLNLIFVLDPNTLEIKWWRIGAVQRQHDPDWMSNGEIMVFNNRMSRDFSDIVTIDPDSFKTTTLLHGMDHGFYTRIRGKHQQLENGTLIVTSSQQGRAFEVDREGGIVLELLNAKPGSDDTNYVLSELSWFPEDYFDAEAFKCIPKI